MTASGKYQGAWQGKRSVPPEDDDIFVYEYDALIVRFVWDRRRDFIAAAVKQGIITAFQGEQLIILHAKRDRDRKLSHYE